MKPQTALVRSDGTIHLDPKAAVHVHLAVIVSPWYPEHDDPLRLDDTLEDFVFPEFGMPLEHHHQRLGDLLHRLVKFGFRRVLRLNPAHQICDVALHLEKSPATLNPMAKENEAKSWPV